MAQYQDVTGKGLRCHGEQQTARCLIKTDIVLLADQYIPGRTHQHLQVR